ncbi:MAG: adenylyltransferase/cytidyltransferase family protein [Candidatus Marinimicrobia bacterium]|nr:adenylyltransferase/cytidyltransferase family protein [Candidatus Neomarinimicrobiota bacterium]
MNRDKISKETANLKRIGKKIVFTNGCFDLLHEGHKNLLKASSSYGDILIVGLNSDSSVKKLKGNKRPIQKANDRKLALLNTGFVDRVHIFRSDTPLELIALIRPDILVKGGDYIPEDVVGHKEVLDSGGEVKIVPITPGFSTTSIIEKMQ